MKNKILPIVLALLLVISLAGNVVLFNDLSKEKVNSNDYQEAMSQLVILKTDLNNANETIADLEEKVENFNATIGTSTVVPEEITAEMLEGLSAELNEEQQEAAEADNTPDNTSNNNGNNNNDNNGNTNNNGSNNNSNNNGNTNTQPQPKQPDIDLSYFQGEGFGDIPTVKPDREFGDDDSGVHGAIAQ